VPNITLNLILAHAGIPPNMSAELGRYEAIETQFAERPTAARSHRVGGAAAVNAKLERASARRPRTADPDQPAVRRLNYTQYQVVSVPGTVYGPKGRPGVPSGLTPAC